MNNESYILALDEGTTSVTALLFDKNGRPVGRSQRELRQIYPQSGWVEQDPEEILHLTLNVAREVVQKAGVPVASVKALGITNQRETTVVWERATGKPVGNAVVWQCRRTAPLCEKLKLRKLEPFIQRRTGLTIDAYFSATKVRWLLDSVPDGQRRAEQGDLLFGTVDSWLIWNFTGGRAHVTDYSNASRTMLFNIQTLEWDKELLTLFDIPRAILPQVIPSSNKYCETDEGFFEGTRIPIAGIAGDQQAALFGQACYHPGMAKNTYGTGSFVLVNTGIAPVFSNSRLITTIGWNISNKVTYALEGSVFVSGAAVQWLRDGLGLITSAAEVEDLANTVPDNGGVYFVPAFVGLGAPYWDPHARGIIIGLTRGTTKGHLARAVLEAMAFQTRDVIDTMISETSLQIPVLRVDGGGSANNLAMQFQADILNLPIQRPVIIETTAAGVAYMAGLAIGLWRDTGEIERYWELSASFDPKMSVDERETLYQNWKRAVERARDWDR